MSVKSKIRGLINAVKEEKKIPIPTQINTTALLQGKVALITGGTGGIGSSIAENFLKNGASVIIAGTSDEKINKLCGKMGEVYGCASRIKGIKINLNDISEFKNVIVEASEMFPEKKIDILVNSAGIINHSDFWHINEDEYDRIMNINLKGVFFFCQAMGEYMIQNSIKGHILNVSSASALRPAWTPYQISKWAIRGFTLGLADTLLPYGITVNAIAPGPVSTQMLKRTDGSTLDNKNAIYGRYAEPEEIANLATFMVSDMGDLIVGDTFYITGGSGTISLHR